VERLASALARCGSRGRPGGVIASPQGSAGSEGSVDLGEQHGGDGPIAFATEAFRDHPDGAVLWCVVAGEEAAFRMGVVRIVGGSVLRIEIAPVAGSMTIEQADDHLMGNGSCDSGSGHDLSEGVTHGKRRGRRDGPAAQVSGV